MALGVIKDAWDWAEETFEPQPGRLIPKNTTAPSTFPCRMLLREGVTAATHAVSTCKAPFPTLLPPPLQETEGGDFYHS